MITTEIALVLVIAVVALFVIAVAAHVRIDNLKEDIQKLETEL